VYWLARPPVFRRVAAIFVMTVALLVGLRRPPTVDFPFSAIEIAPGSVIAQEMVELRSIAAGFIEPSDPVGSRALVPIAAGRPLTAEVIGPDPGVPVGWWALDLPVPPGLTAGSPVQVVISPIQDEAAVAVPGVAVVSGGANQLGENTAMVAVPGSRAVLVAVAARDSRVTVLLGTG
jgi:hypothetical protein